MDYVQVIRLNYITRKAGVCLLHCPLLWLDQEPSSWANMQTTELPHRYIRNVPVIPHRGTTRYGYNNAPMWSLSSFHLDELSNLPDSICQRKSDKRHSLICMTVTVFIAFWHLFAELDRDYRLQKYKKISEQTRKTPDYFVFR